eukprot:jgi/Mesen1/3830/ME000207S02841
MRGGRRAMLVSDKCEVVNTYSQSLGTGSPQIPSPSPDLNCPLKPSSFCPLAGAHVCAMLLWERLKAAARLPPALGPLPPPGSNALGDGTPAPPGGGAGATAMADTRQPYCFVGLSGVYDIGEHYRHEQSRGVAAISCMRAANGGTSNFPHMSPARLFAGLAEEREERRGGETGAGEAAGELGRGGRRKRGTGGDGGAGSALKLGAEEEVAARGAETAGERSSAGATAGPAAAAISGEQNPAGVPTAGMPADGRVAEEAPAAQEGPGGVVEIRVDSSTIIISSSSPAGQEANARAAAAAAAGAGLTARLLGEASWAQAAMRANREPTTVQLPNMRVGNKRQAAALSGGGGCSGQVEASEQLNELDAFGNNSLPPFSQAPSKTHPHPHSDQHQCEEQPHLSHLAEAEACKESGGGGAPSVGPDGRAGARAAHEEGRGGSANEDEAESPPVCPCVLLCSPEDVVVPPLTSILLRNALTRLGCSAKVVAYDSLTHGDFVCLTAGKAPAQLEPYLSDLMGLLTERLPLQALDWRD